MKISQFMLSQAVMQRGSKPRPSDSYRAARREAAKIRFRTAPKQVRKS